MSPEPTPSFTAQRQRLHTGLIFRTGPFVVRLTTSTPSLARTFSDFYGRTEIQHRDALPHFSIGISESSLLRRPTCRQCIFWLNDFRPFEPYPASHAFPMLEWGLNWCIGTRAHRHLMLHAGVVERDGKALLLPATPGSGKSTLSAALAHRGWRLLSDEIGIVLQGAEAIHPLPRAIPLKNASIPVFRNFEPSAFMGPVFEKTRKGDVSHVRPPGDSLSRQLETATPAWIVFPRYAAGSQPAMRSLARSEAFIRLAQNAFNYRLMGRRAFLELTSMVRGCACHSIRYGSLEDALPLIDRITGNA